MPGYDNPSAFLRCAYLILLLPPLSALRGLGAYSPNKLRNSSLLLVLRSTCSNSSIACAFV